MSEPLFYNQLCKKKSGVGPSYVMSLVTTFQVKKWGILGHLSPPKWRVSKVANGRYEGNRPCYFVCGTP